MKCRATAITLRSSRRGLPVATGSQAVCQAVTPPASTRGLGSLSAAVTACFVWPAGRPEWQHGPLVEVGAEFVAVLAQQVQGT